MKWSRVKTLLLHAGQLLVAGFSWVRRPRLVRWALRVIGAGALLLSGLDLIFPINTQIPNSTLVYAREGTLLNAFLSQDDKWRLPLTVDEVPEQLENAFLYKEDRFFYRHPGINPFSVLRAGWNNLTTGRRTSGASTITLQVVRLLEPRPRTYGSKVIEFVRALQLELNHSKPEILRLYLSLAPYGGNVEGVKAAALLYFGRDLSSLSAAQVATLTSIPNRPTSLRPGPGQKLLLAARNKWLARFGKANIWDAVTIESAKLEPLDIQRYPLPKLAPHLARRLQAAQPGQPILRSTLLPQAQRAAQQITQDYVRRIRHLGIKQAAVLVVDNQTRQVVAYVGSADFESATSAGQVDGVMAVRSPGSALKPLLYGLAFDQGIATPQTALYDVPTNFSGYAPENYDDQFRGRVTAAFALENSLNVPAVLLLQRLGINKLIGALTAARFGQVRQDAGKLGLSIILGGCGVRLEEMTALYAAFANQGHWQGLTYTTDASKPDTTRILSVEGSYVLTDILSQLTRPDLPNNALNARDIPRIAWKTGTSYGRRDAWAIGYNRRYTIGVWCGNFDGVGNQALAGADIATPLLFRVFNAIDRSTTSEVISAPRSLRSRPVCAITGLPPDTFCTDLKTDYFLPGISASQRCSHLKLTWISSEGNISYCSHCLPPSGYQQVLLPDYPPELLAWYRSNRIGLRQVPPHNPVCQFVTSRSQLVIASPPQGAEYFLDRYGKQRLALEAQAPADSRQLYWFVQGRYYGKAAPGESLFFSPDTGRIPITVTDDRGRSHTVQIQVHAY